MRTVKVASSITICRSKLATFKFVSCPPAPALTLLAAVSCEIASTTFLEIHTCKEVSAACTCELRPCAPKYVLHVTQAHDDAKSHSVDANRQHMALHNHEPKIIQIVCTEVCNGEVATKQPDLNHSVIAQYRCDQVCKHQTRICRDITQNHCDASYTLLQCSRTAVHHTLCENKKNAPLSMLQKKHVSLACCCNLRSALLISFLSHAWNPD